MDEIDADDLLGRITRAARGGMPYAELRGLDRLVGGVSSLTFASTLVTDREELPIVVKIAPAGLPPVRNRDVLRQAHVLRQLADVPGFPVPEVLFEDVGAPPQTPPLFAMTRSPGQAYEPLLDVLPLPPTAEVAAARMLAAARALARLQALPPARLGLADEPVAAVGAELERWHRLFATIDDDIAPAQGELHARLVERVPSGLEPRLLHGDYRLANMLFTGSTLEAVIDWEIWSVGDPRIDLAWLLMHLQPAHRFHEERPAGDRVAGSNLPSRPRLVAAYADECRLLGARVGEVEKDLGWFLGLAHYKVASTVAAIHKRERKRPDPDPALMVAGEHLDDVLAAGHQALDVLDPRS